MGGCLLAVVVSREVKEESMGKLRGNYVVRGEFLRFHHSHPYNEKTFGYKLMNMLASTEMMRFTFFQARPSLIDLHTSSSLGETLLGGTILFLNVPPEEKARVDKIRWDEKLQEVRDLYIDWGNEPCEFRAVRVEKGLLSSGELGKRVTLDELIGSGKVLEPFYAETIDLSGERAIKRYVKRIQDSFYILRLTLYRKKRWFKEHWTWALGIEYIGKKKGSRFRCPTREV